MRASIDVSFACDYDTEAHWRVVVEQIYERAKRYAEVAARTKPVAEDVLVACEEYDLDIKELRKEGRKRRRGRKNSQSPLALTDKLYCSE